ncbi:PTS sugar transporter subunit IIC [Oceanobacillus sp. CFH 90083]|uniref:PTS sugar transporter subunit IIC n=1 Tax=Oceanobacillus sp. CFH 90083 TaxID=2592336 RepID=UPI00128B1C7F|nr:PTS transporter subunit EIIC [Oceanobacillus sp. CFH 90083]
MKKFIAYMNRSFAPKMNKITRNAWISAIQESIMGVLPLILVGSLITLIMILNDFIPNMPNLQPISDFSFGLMSLFISFLIPYFVMEKLKKSDRKLVAGLTGTAMFFLVLSPSFNDEGQIIFSFERFGASGMFVAIIIGLLVGVVFHQSSKVSFFKETSSLPDFIIIWFDTIIPITILLLAGWFATILGNFDLYASIISLFEPLINIGQSFVGFVLICFITAFLYSFGISSWALMPVAFPIIISGIEQNARQLSRGLEPSLIHTQETLAAWILIGGVGATLPLVIIMLGAKSKHLKAISRVTIIPSIFNINEPVVFGAPIAFNPILMIPMWLNAIIIPAITYIVLSLGVIAIPAEVMQLWYLPVGVSTYLVNTDLRGLVLLLINIVISFIIWYPFVKVYDNQKVMEEKQEEQV